MQVQKNILYTVWHTFVRIQKGKYLLKNGVQVKIDMLSSRNVLSNVSTF